MRYSITLGAYMYNQYHRAAAISIRRRYAPRYNATLDVYTISIILRQISKKPWVLNCWLLSFPSCLVLFGPNMHSFCVGIYSSHTNLSACSQYMPSNSNRFSFSSPYRWSHSRLVAPRSGPAEGRLHQCQLHRRFPGAKPVHRRPGPADRHIRRLLAADLGATRPDCRHDHQPHRKKQGQSSGDVVTGIARSFYTATVLGESWFRKCRLRCAVLRRDQAIYEAISAVKWMFMFPGS